jgi:hypothetical protein
MCLRANMCLVRPVFVIAGLLLVMLVPADYAAGAAAGKPLTVRAQAVGSLPGRFHNISTVACSPDKSSATAVRRGVRHWQRFWCAGWTRQGVSFRLRFEKTGACAACWRITRLAGTSAADLRTKRPASAAPSTTPSPVAPGPTQEYPGLGAGHALSDFSGDVARLNDGSLWLVSPTSRAAVAKWQPLAHITVRTGTEAGYGYRLVNTDEQETAIVRFLRID